MADGKVHIYEGKVLIVDGKVARCDDDCCLVLCAACLEGFGAKEYQVTVGGFVDVDCHACAAMNDDWVVTEVAECTYTYIQNNFPCTGLQFVIRMSFKAPLPPFHPFPYIDVVVRLEYPPGLAWDVWSFEKNYPDGIPCSALANVSIPLHFQEFPGDFCEGDPPTVNVTTL